MSKPLTTPQFTERAQEVHGSRYDYSLVEYVNSKAKVKIICQEHGVFEQMPTNHLNSAGCQKCGFISIKTKIRKTTGEFIERAQEVHGSRYDYSLVEYVDSKTKVKIICQEHGVFEQLPTNHLKSGGCHMCGYESRAVSRRKSEKEFIEQSQEVHGSKYNYSLVEYTHSKTKVKIICPEHGVFEQTPSLHISGSNCPKCSYEHRGLNLLGTTDKFISESNSVHGSKYDYSLVEYVGSHTKVKIICPEHGIFKQTPTNHVNQNGCPKCSYEDNGVRRSLTTEDFIKRAREVHGDKYDYSLVDYIHNTKCVKIICPEHGVFEQTLNDHINSSCPICTTEKHKQNQYIKFINKAREVHGDKYDYYLVDYTHSKTKVKIICPEHGVFEQNPNVHLLQKGCLECLANSQRDANFTNFINKAREVHGDKYDYSLIDYISCTVKVEIICPQHGSFLQTPSSHLKGSNCRDCWTEGLSLDFVKKYTNNESLGQSVGLFYVLKFKHVGGFEFIKVGITSRNVESRFKRGYEEFTYEIIHTVELTNLEVALLEQRVLSMLKESKKPFKFPKGVVFSGRTECFDLNETDLNELLQKANETLRCFNDSQSNSPTVQQSTKRHAAVSFELKK